MRTMLTQLSTMAQPLAEQEEAPNACGSWSATDSIGALSSRRAGEVIASGWLPGAEVSVLPIGEAGGGFAAAYADLAGVTTSSRVADGDHRDDRAADQTRASSRFLDRTQVLGFRTSSRPDRSATPSRHLLRSEPRHAGSLSIWPACGSMTPVPACSLRSVQPQIGRSIKVSPASMDSASWILRRPGRCWVRPSWSAWCPLRSVGQPLLGLRGITSRAGREAGRGARADASNRRSPGSLRRGSPRRLTRQRPGQEHAAASGSRCLHWAERLSTGPALTLASAAGQQALRDVDLVVTGCSVFDFASRGGGVVAAMAEAAAAALSPCIVIAGEVLIGSREMRTMGIEAAYAVRESLLDEPQGEISEEELACDGSTGGPVLELVTRHTLLAAWTGQRAPLE